METAQPGAGPETIEETYKAANRHLLEIRGQLERLEAGVCPSLVDQGRLSASLNSLSRLADTLAKRVSAEPQGPRRELWTIRARQLEDECRSLRGSMFEYMTQRDARAREQEEREMLLEGRTPESAARATRMGYLFTEEQSLGRSLTMADDIEDQGKQILIDLEEQRKLTKTVRGKLGMFNRVLGLSKDVMRAFERRVTVDRWIVFAGMALTLVVLFGLYYLLS
eukprot:m51a1_g11762 putative C-tail anchored protein, C-terminal SNARE domain (224) ;mRNA; f:225951-226799